MKVAIHQPEHFPYMGFFQKAKEADLLIKNKKQQRRYGIKRSQLEKEVSKKNLRKS